MIGDPATWPPVVLVETFVLIVLTVPGMVLLARWFDKRHDMRKGKSKRKQRTRLAPLDPDLEDTLLMNWWVIEDD